MPLLDALQLRISSAIHSRFGGRGRRVLRVRLFGYPNLIHVRTGSSDAMVLRQIFHSGQYDPLRSLSEISSIIDCGANIGLSAAYLARMFPHARIVAVEPDPGNASQCRKNIIGFGGRVQVIDAAVWHASGMLRLVRQQFRDGLEWSTQVACLEADSDAPTVPAVDLNTLIAKAGFGRVGLLKIDIEGAEQQMFGANTAWLERVDNLVIEIHGSECEYIVRRALASFSFIESHSHELHLFLNLRRRGAPTSIEGGSGTV